MPPVVDLEVTDVSEATWEDLVGQLDPSFTIEDHTTLGCSGWTNCAWSCVPPKY